MLGDVNVGTERRNVGGDGRYCLAGAGAVGCCHCSLASRIPTGIVEVKWSEK